MASFPLPMRRRSAIERRVLSMLRVDPAELGPYLKRLDAAQPRSRRYVIPKRDDCIEILRTLRQMLGRHGINLLDPSSQYVSQDEALLLNWLAEAQRVVPRYQAPGDPALRSAIRSCAEMFDAHGHRLSLGPMVDPRGAPDRLGRSNGASVDHLGVRGNGHDRMTIDSERPETDRLPFRARPVSMLQPARASDGSAGSPLSDLLGTLIDAARCNRIAAPVDAPDDPSLLDGFAAMQAASSRFDVLPGLSLTDHLWTHHSHLRNGDITTRLMESSRRAASLKLEGLVQGFILLFSTYVRSPLLYVPKRSPFRVKGRVEGMSELDGPFIALVQCALAPDGKAEAVRAFAQPIYHARRFVPVASALERDVLRALEGLQVALDAHGVDCAIERPTGAGAEGGVATILVTAGRAGERAQQLRIAVSPAADDTARPEIDFVVTPARWSDGSFVAWLDRAIVR